jgi:Cft2 family RNA processing exonuclease
MLPLKTSCLALLLHNSLDQKIGLHRAVLDSSASANNSFDCVANNKRPAIVIAASGMCNGGHVMNYLKAMLGDARHDVLFVGYQASGTIGRLIQKYGPGGGYVTIDGKRTCQILLKGCCSNLPRFD